MNEDSSSSVDQQESGWYSRLKEALLGEPATREELLVLSAGNTISNGGRAIEAKFYRLLNRALAGPVLTAEEYDWSCTTVSLARLNIDSLSTTVKPIILKCNGFKQHCT